MRVPKKTFIYLGAALLLTIVIFVMPLFVFSGSLGVLESINDMFAPKENVTTRVSFGDPNQLAYNVEAVEISPFGATLLSGDSSAELLMLNATKLQKKASITGFTQDAEIPPDTSIYYQVSVNNRNWLYHDGVKWLPIGDCRDCGNTAQELDNSLNELTLEDDSLRIKAILASDGAWSPVLRSIDIVSIGDGVYVPIDGAARQQLLAASASSGSSGSSSGCECDGKMTDLTLRYNGNESAAIRVEQKKPLADVFNDVVQPGAEFSFSGIDKDGTLGTEINVYINGSLDVSIHTSCSKPIAIGLDFGAFTVMDGASLKNGPLCGPTSTQSDLVATGECYGDDKVKFFITNQGNADMTGPVEFRVYRDGNLEVTDTVELDAGKDDDFKYPVTYGEVMTIEVDQESNHPTGIASTYELTDCGDCTCKGGVTSLNLRYNSTESAQIMVESSNGILFNGTVSAGGTFSFVGLGSDNKMGDLDVLVNGALDVEIHTSCSQPMEIGLDYGSFTIMDGTSKYNGKFCGSAGGNRPPVAVDDNATTPPSTPVTIDLLANDSDPDGDNINVTQLITTIGPNNGTATPDLAAGTVVYTPNDGFLGTDQFEYEICDDGTPVLCDTAMVTVLVEDDTYDGPNLTVSVECYNNKEAKFIITNTAGSPEGDMQSPTEYRIYRDGDLEATGTVELDGGKDEDFKHPAGYYSVISIEVDQVAGHPSGAPATAQITECGDCTCEGQVVSLTLRYNGSEAADIMVDSKDGELFNGTVDPDGTFSFVGLGNDGKMGSSIDVYINGTLDVSIHTSCSETIEIGMNFGSFTIMDGASKYNGRLCGSAGNRPPVAVDDEETTAPSTPVTIDLLVNDSDPDNDNIALTELLTLIGPNNGTVSPDLVNGEATYTPNDGFFGTDYFEYRICDDGVPSLCDTAKVTVTIEGWDGSDLEASGVCYDNKEARFTVSNMGVLNLGDMAGPVEYRIYRNDVLEASGTVQLDAGHSELIKHPAGYYDNIRIEVDQRPGHPNGVPADATVANCGDCTCRGGVTTLTLQYLGDEAVDIIVDTKKGEVFNDTVQPGSQFSFVGLEGDNKLGDQIDIYIDGELDVTVHTSCSETIEIGMTFGSFEVLYGESKYNGRLCGKTVEENDPPVAVDDYVSLGINTEDDPSSIDILVLDNDYDPNGHPIRLDDILVDPFHGTLSVDYTTGVVTYTPDVDFTGTDSFEYQIFDIPGGSLTALSDTATVYITVSPVAVDDEVWTSISTPVEIQVLSNDYDIDGVLVPDTVTYVDGSLSPTGGTVTVNPVTGVVTYTPPAGFVGDVTFDYTVDDDDGNTATAEVLVHVTGGPPPISCSITALDDYAVTEPETAVEITIMTNDTTGGNCTKQTSSLTLISQANPDAVIELDKVTGLANYTPPPGIDKDEFVYQICTIPNPGQYCDIATVFVTIRSGGGPLPPVAVNDEETTQINTPVTIDVLDNDFDWDNDLDPDSLILLSGAGNEPNNGEAVIDSATNTVIYTPDEDFIGVDTFRYEVYDLTRLSDTATVTVTINPDGVLIPPIATDDSVTTPYETPVVIPVLGNDFDPDGILINSTLLMTSPPSFGTVSPSPLTGTFTYTPISGYIGFDSFEYEICDNDGLCDTARVSINVLPPFIPPPILPPAIPPIVIPAPVVPIVPEIISLNCPAPLTNTNTVTITGDYTGDLDDVIGIEYSVTDGLSWRPITAITGTDAGADFNFTLNDLQSGEYRVRARVITSVDGFTSSVSSESCPLIVDLGLIFGANQFILGAQPSPMTDQGTIHFIVDQKHRFYLESRGASEAFLRVLETDETFPLVWDVELKLWTGELIFDEPGFYRLEGTIANSLRGYTREINSIMVTRGTDILDQNTAEKVDGLVVTVYERTPDGEEFKLWNAQAYAQSNPDRVDGGFAFVVPPGEFYVTIEHSNYDKLTSLITSVPEQSVISANISLDTTGGLFGRIGRLFSRTGTTNNFALTVRPAPPTELLIDDEVLPNISFTTDEDEETTLYEVLAGSELPNVLFVYSTWNTNAQMQIDIYRRLADTYGDQVNIIPVATMEPKQLKSSQISRGAYDFDFLQPDDQFYEDYFIISLPAFYAVDSEGVLLNKLFGPRSESTISDWFERTFDL